MSMCFACEFYCVSDSTELKSSLPERERFLKTQKVRKIHKARGVNKIHWLLDAPETEKIQGPYLRLHTQQ